MRRRDIVAAAAGAAVATVLAGSVAWAAIPGDGGVYTACMLKNVGTVRLIDKSLPPVRINMLSDTQTKPTPAMREAIARAEVGDEQVGDDPSVNLLCERVADLLGKEAAVFLPSGTMCNVTAQPTNPAETTAVRRSMVRNCPRCRKCRR